jgi:glycosyltransferase involved in cell wall biosynthesis
MIKQNQMVSVCMITYNHEAYISEAIEGVLMQQTTFSIELIIGEDCSTDNTRNICIEYQEKYPDKIKLLLPETNLGMMQNFITSLQACTGKYIALCEGDDYWTDPLKLQKQVDFLEANKDYSICFHNVKVLDQGQLKEDFICKEMPETTTLKYLVTENFIHTSSVLFRKNKNVIDELETMNSPAGDYILHMLNAKYGKIKKLKTTMAVYRYGIGLWSKQTNWMISLKNISIYGSLVGHFNEEINSKLETAFLQSFKSIACSSLSQEHKEIIIQHFQCHPLTNELLCIIFSRYLTIKQERQSIKKLVRRLFVLIKTRFLSKVLI